MVQNEALLMNSLVIVGFGSEIFDEAARLKEVKEIHDRIISFIKTYLGS